MFFCYLNYLVGKIKTDSSFWEVSGRFTTLRKTVYFKDKIIKIINNLDIGWSSGIWVGMCFLIISSLVGKIKRDSGQKEELVLSCVQHSSSMSLLRPL